MAVALAQDGVHGVDDFCAAAVIKGDGKNHAGVFGEGFGGFAGVSLDGFGEIIRAAEEAHANIVSLQERHFLANVFAEELHEEFDFGFGAAPVFDGEGVEGEGFDAQAGAGFDGCAGGIRAGAVTGDAREMALLGPAAVAVHDDGDVAGEAGEIELFEETGLLGGDRAEGFEMGMAVQHGGYLTNLLYAAKLTQGFGGCNWGCGKRYGREKKWRVMSDPSLVLRASAR